MGPGTTREYPGLRLTGPNGGCKAAREREGERETHTQTYREKDRLKDRNVANNDKERTNQ